jgi:predicted PurR-regulated permease PerM
VLIDKVGAYMIGNIVVSLVAGLAAFTALTALTALGVPFAVPLALVVAVFDLIPMIGAVICVLVALLATSAQPASEEHPRTRQQARQAADFRPPPPGRVG